MRTGDVRVTADGVVSATPGLLGPIVTRLIEQQGSPEAIAQKLDQQLAASNLPPSAPTARAAYVEGLRSGDEKSWVFLAQGLSDYLQVKIALAVDADQSVDPSVTCVFYAPSGSMTSARTVSIVGSPIDGDFLLVRNDSSSALTVASVATLATGKWVFAMSIRGNWVALAGS